jgi:hypothetical protein
MTGCFLLCARFRNLRSENVVRSGKEDRNWEWCPDRALCVAVSFSFWMCVRLITACIDANLKAKEASRVSRCGPRWLQAFTTMDTGSVDANVDLLSALPWPCLTCSFA